MPFSSFLQTLPAAFSAILLLIMAPVGSAQVVINEIHYNPVERPAFDADGNPVFQGTNTPADFTDDVHEFVELHNPTAEAVSIAGWRLAGGVEFTFPADTTLPAIGYLVIAKNPARIQAVYGITGVLGPYAGKLSNNGDAVQLLTPANATSDSVRYEVGFPWAISADRLGANDDFTLLVAANYQYKGRSLQRVSATANSNDPSNWVAVRPTGPGTTFADLPTPGAANIISLPVPRPVVIAQSATQLTDGAAIIRNTSQVRILATFSNVAPVSAVEVEYFVDNINLWNEAKTTVAMTSLGNGQYSATLPTQADRSVVRYRIKADRGAGSEVVSPRADDPAIVPTGMTTREAWHAYFVTPTRSSSKPIYDCFVSTDGQPVTDNVNGNIYPFTGLNGLQTLAYNAMGNLKRVLAGGLTTNTYPRELGWPGVTTADRIWNGTVPGIFVENGTVRDVQIRYHGSRYNRRPSRKSYKMLFADYQLYQQADSVFITDKGDPFMTAHGLHQLAGLPLSNVRYVDWYLNNEAMQTRLEQGEYNGDLLDIYHEKMQRLNPGSAREQNGEYYKSSGVIQGTGNATLPFGSPSGGEGPYGTGNAWPLPATGGSPAWTELQRYDYTYALQNHAWKGAKPIRDMINGMWAARGDSYQAVNPNIANLRTWLQQNWDVDTELTALALGNWMAPWDDSTQNHFFWRRANGKWVRLLWDFDAMYNNSVASSSIYVGEVGDSANNFRGPHYTKDSFFKAFREEYKARLWYLNNTLLDPDNLQALTFRNNGGNLVTFATSIGAFASARFNAVNSQVNLGTFYKPTRPTNTSPSSNATVLPGANLIGSVYGYDAAFTHTAAPVVRPHTSSKWEIRASSGSYDDPVYFVQSTTNLTSLPIPFDQLTYGQTYFWRVTYFDADNHPSITSAETAFSYGPASVSAGNITINEVMAENLTAVSNGLDRPDYIELKNNTASAVSIAGWRLTDDELQPSKFVFPAGTTIPAQGYLVVWCDSNFTSPGMHTGFALSRQGERIILITDTNVVRDAVTFGPQAPNAALGRITNGLGSWTLIEASPGAANTARPFSTATTTLKINEWMATPASGDDWFEIHNSGSQHVAIAGLWLSDDPATPKLTQIPPLSFIAPGGCVRFDANASTAGFNNVNFRLAAGGETVLLSSSNGTTVIDSVTFGSQSPGVSQGRFPDASNTITSFPVSPSPNDNNWLPASVRINEVLASSVAPAEDYVELHNPTNADVDVGSWWLSDDPSAKQKYQLPAGTIIPAGGFLLVPESALNIGANAFALSSSGDEIVLSAADGGGVLSSYRSQFAFGASADGVSFGSIATALAPVLWPQSSSTPSAVNSAPAIGPVIINEVHYRPPDQLSADNSRDEFIELHNITRYPVDLTGWQLEGNSDFTFPAGSSIAGGAYILVVSFDPGADPNALAAFRAALNVPANVPVFGPYAPILPNSSARVELAKPFTADGGATRMVDVDQVEYTDFAPWPVTADGGGASVQRLSRTFIGNDAANWAGAAPTPGAVNAGQSPLVFPVLITEQPQGQTINPGSPIMLSVTADGTAPVTYQWRKNLQAIDGATTSSLALAGNEADEGSYDVIVSNSAGPVTSDPAVVTVNDPVVITDSPDSQTVNPNATVVFTVSATGTAPLTYQWRRNTEPIDGATDATYSFTASEPAEGTYDVVVRNIVGPQTSSAAVLSVNDPVLITDPPDAISVAPGSPATFSVTVSGTGPFQYQWRKGTAPIDGATSASFTIPAAQESDEGAYNVVVSNIVGFTTSSDATLDVINPVTITGDPRSVVVKPGGTATFTVTATGGGPLQYQWRRNTTPINGATNATFQIGDVQEDKLGSYDVVVSNGAGSETSAGATLSFVDWSVSAGTYQGALVGPNPADPASNPFPGRVTAKIAKNGRFTGKLEYRGVTRLFKGEFNADLKFTSNAVRRDDATVELTGHLDAATHVFMFTTRYPDGMETHTAEADAPKIPTRTKANPTARAGRFTMLLAPSTGAPTGMRAPGFLTMTITPTGKVSWAGKLPDAIALRGSGLLTGDGALAFHAGLYSGRTALAGQIAGPMVVGADGIASTFGWRKPAQSKSGYFQAGHTALLDVEGSAWTPPARGQPLLPTAGFEFQLTASFSATMVPYPPLSLGATGRFTPQVSGPERLSMSLNRTTGQLTGKYFDTFTGKMRTLFGVYLQTVARGAGQMPASGEIRHWTLEPTAP